MNAATQKFDARTKVLAADLGADTATYHGIILRAAMRHLLGQPDEEIVVAIEEAVAEFDSETSGR